MEKESFLFPGMAAAAGSKDDKPTRLSTGQILALVALLISFLIVLILFIYYWWEVGQLHDTQRIASEIRAVNPNFADALVSGQIRCTADLPDKGGALGGIPGMGGLLSKIPGAGGLLSKLGGSAGGASLLKAVSSSGVGGGSLLKQLAK